MTLWLIKEAMMFLILKIWEEALFLGLTHRAPMLDVVHSPIVKGQYTAIDEPYVVATRGSAVPLSVE